MKKTFAPQFFIRKFKQKFFSIVALVFLISCTSKNVPKVKLFSSGNNGNHKKQNFGKKKINFAIGAMISPVTTFKYYKDLIALMEKSTGLAVDLMQRVYDLIKAAAKISVPVLIYGESGTKKN